LTDGIDFKLIEDGDKEREIKNELWANHALEKGQRKIELSKYLQDIEGYAIVKKKAKFIRSLQQIELEGDVYIYKPRIDGGEQEGYDDQDAELFEVEDLNSVPIDDYIFENRLRYLAIPIIDRSSTEDVDNGFKFTDGGISDVIEKLKDDLNWVSILIPNTYVKEIQEEELSRYVKLIDGVSFDWLKGLGQAPGYSSYRYFRSVKLFEGIKNELYMPFQVNEPSMWWYRYSSTTPGDLFIRGVLIKDFRFTIPFAASVFEIVSVVINIKSRKVIPDVARNDLDAKSRSTIDYAIGKAVHFALIDSLEYVGEEQKALQDFVRIFYGERTDFEV
jgi:molecular chaperone HtpG